VGVDGLTTLLRANAYFNVDDFGQTVKAAEQSIRLEPDREDPYHSLAAGYVGLKKYRDAIKAYQTLAAQFGYHFERQHFAGDTRFAGFVKSAEFKRWLPK
jgi:hypothetical protein